MNKNAKLSRIHWILALAYAIGGALLFVLFVLGGDKAQAFAAVGCLLAVTPIFLVHWFAMRGARQGAGWGRTLSRVIGAIMLIGFPLGTIIGAYILSQTGKKWEPQGVTT